LSSSVLSADENACPNTKTKQVIKNNPKQEELVIRDWVLARAKTKNLRPKSGFSCSVLAKT
jgi:hypothetical protein